MFVLILFIVEMIYMYCSYYSISFFTNFNLFFYFLCFLNRTFIEQSITIYRVPTSPDIPEFFQFSKKKHWISPDKIEKHPEKHWILLFSS